MREGYDQMQVCKNGHQITASAVSFPEFRSVRCTECGAPTIDACEKCGTPIRGHLMDSMSISEVPVPKYCHNCGEPHPWQRAAVENLQELLREGGLSDQDIGTVEAALPDVLHNTPKTESASLKLKRLLGKLGKPAYDIAIKVITDIASETAKKTMGLP